MLVKSDGQRFETSTMGFNPFFHNEDVVEREILKNDLLRENADKILQICFFAAGASSAERNAILERGLRRVFKNTTSMIVDHDLKGAANRFGSRRTWNSPVYLEQVPIHAIMMETTVLEAVPALGYVLGDEGSGAYFGKILLSKYLYKKLPIELAAMLEKDYGVSKESIFEAVYNKPNPNVYLASFMKFAKEIRIIHSLRK